MIIKLTSLMFFSAVLSITLFDKKRLNTILTPFTVTAWPFVMVSLLVNFFLVPLGFRSMTLRVHLFVLANLMILWIIGLFMSFFHYRQDNLISEQNRTQRIFEPFTRYLSIVVGIGWVVIFATFYRAYSLMKMHGGFAFLGDFRFEEMMTIGLTAHLVQVGKVCFILLGFLYKSSNRKILIWVTLIGLFFAIAAIQVKYHLLWLLIILFLFNNLDKPVKNQLKSLGFVCVAIILIMNLFWILLTLAWGTFSFSSKGIWEFLLKQTLNYITTGPVALDQWLDHADVKPAWTLLIVFINTIYVLFGNPLRLSALNYVNIGFLETAPGLVSNVGTAYGVYYIIGGLVFAFFMTAWISIVSYWIYFRSIRLNNPYLVFLNLVALTIGALTFFVQYFTLVSLYEMIGIYLLLIAAFQFVNYVRTKPNDSIFIKGMKIWK